MSGIRPVKCTIEVRKLPIEAFKHPSLGRKWKTTARRLRALLLELASYADGDGTLGKFSPSMKTLEKIYPRATLYRHMDQLRDLGLLQWDRKDHHQIRQYSILLPEKPVSQSDGEQVSDSGEQVSDSHEHVSSSETNRSHSCEHHPSSVIRTVQPTVRSELIGRMGGSFGQRVNRLPKELKPGLHHKKLQPELDRLIERDGADTVCVSWEYFLDNRDFDGLNQSALQLFLTEFEQHKAASKEAARQTQRRKMYVIDPNAPDPFAPSIDPNALTPEQLVANRYKI